MLRTIFSALLWSFMALLALSGSSAFAVDFYWLANSDSTIRGGSPSAVCASSFATSGYAQEPAYAGNKAVFASETIYRCFTTEVSTGKDQFYDSALRRGDGCPLTSTYNASTGLCVSELTCPYGQMQVNGACGAICPQGQHYGRTALVPFEVSGCLDNCPANTFDTTSPGKLSVCSPTPPKDTSDVVKTTCDSGFLIVGFAADGSAICKSKPVPPDPCPKGTHNISADVSTPNCTANKQEKQEGNTTAPTPNPDGSKTVTKTETTTNANGTTETKTTKTTTNADGSEKTEVTYSGTGNGSATKGGDGTGTNANGAGGAGGGGGGGKQDEGDGVSELPENLYEKKKQTFGGSVQTFKDKVVGAPIVTAGSGFFKGQISGGGCFNGVVAIPFLKTSVDFAQYLCGGNVSEVLKVMAIGLMIGASFAAFRMGFL